MNIIIHRYNSICEPDYIRAFKTIGLDVIEDTEEMVNKSISAQRRVDTMAELILTHRPLFVFSINYFPYISMVCEKLHVTYVAVSVDCPVDEIYDISIRNSCNKIFLFDRAQYLSVKDENPTGIFHLPLGVDAGRIDGEIGEFNTGSEGYSTDLNNTDASETKILPVASQPLDFHPKGYHEVVDSLGYPGAASHHKWCDMRRFAQNDNNYDYDISFIGSLYNEKDPYANLSLSEIERVRFNSLIDEQFHLPGLSLIEEKLTAKDVDIFKKLDPDFPDNKYCIRNMDITHITDHYLSYHLTHMDRVSLLNHLAMELPEYKVHLFTRSNTDELKDVICHGGVSSHVEMPRVFRTSRINLNTTMRAIRTGLPQRIWDVLGSGGFLLTNAQTEIPEFLQIGTHLDVYETQEELAEKCRYYLTHEDERRQIAINGYLAVKKDHTVLNRVISMISIISNG